MVGYGESHRSISLFFICHKKIWLGGIKKFDRYFSKAPICILRSAVGLLRGFSMRVSTKKCRTSIRIVLGIIFLALAVFGWGVKYKISLYDPPGSISTHMSHAKLLSQKERPAPSSDLDLVRPPLLPPQSSILFPTFLVAAIVLGSSITISLTMLREATDDDSRRQRRSNSIYFSFRPPPALLPSLLIR
jgi:hypothetical protein